MGSNVKASVKEKVNAPLPQEMIKGKDLTADEAISHIEKLLRQTLPTSDQHTLRTDLKWQFLLEQHAMVKSSKRKQKKTFLTRKQRKKMNLLKLPKEGWDYQSLKPVRNMWKQYMRENFDLMKKVPLYMSQEWNSFSVIVAKSEMVGANLKVVKSKVPSLIGMMGTVVLETKMSFQLITPQNKLKTVLKDTSVFEFILDDMKFTFLGKHLATRPSDRSVKKIKSLMKLEL